MRTEGKTVSELAQICQNEGISLVFDQDTSSSRASRSRSCSGSSYDSRNSSGSSRRQRRPRRRHNRSSSNSSSSSVEGHNITRARSRSHPRCHRMSSRCRCCKQAQYRSVRRHYRAHSYSSSPTRDGSTVGKKDHRQTPGRNQCMLSRSPPRKMKTYRSRSRSSERSTISQSLEEKKNLLMIAKANATKNGVKKQALSGSVEPILKERPVETSLAPQTNPEPEERVRPVCEKNQTQNNWTEADEDSPILNLSSIRKVICFSINNSVAKPTVGAPLSSAVSYAPIRVDGFTSRQPYGHWVPVRKTRQNSQHRKHRHTTSC